MSLESAQLGSDMEAEEAARLASNQGLQGTLSISGRPSWGKLADVWPEFGRFCSKGVRFGRNWGNLFLAKFGRFGQIWPIFAPTLADVGQRLPNLVELVRFVGQYLARLNQI